MTETRFLEERGALQHRKDCLQKEINDEYRGLSDDFIKDNSSVETSKVYELVKNGNKRRGFKRFVVYNQKIVVWDKADIFIKAEGWWLNDLNVPTKWDEMTVLGVGNPAIFKLSENQINEKHPDDKN